MPKSDTALSPSQRRVLDVLKRQGDATADELAAILEISPGAVRQHLAALRSADLVDSQKVHGRTGRPADRYRATDRAEPVFVTIDTSLSVDLLGHIEAEDPALVDRVFERRRRKLVDDQQVRLAGRSTEEQVTALTELLDVQGYLADCDVVGPDHYRISLHNCAIWAVANRFPQACTAELDFLRGVLPEARVERVTHKSSGGHTCAYDIRLGN